jgi:hypothetical protein
MATIREAFQTPFQQYRERDGQPFTIVRKIEEPNSDYDAESLPMYVIRFNDGEVIDAWPVEVEDPASWES